MTPPYYFPYRKSMHHLACFFLGNQNDCQDGILKSKWVARKYIEPPPPNKNYKLSQKMFQNSF